MHLDRDGLTNWVRWNEPLEMFNRYRLARRIWLRVEGGGWCGEADSHCRGGGNKEQ
jgi:hypothetical protein